MAKSEKLVHEYGFIPGVRPSDLTPRKETKLASGIRIVREVTGDLETGYSIRWTTTLPVDDGVMVLNP